MAVLFADGINLDDLLPGRFVIHDQDDAVQASFVPVSASHSARPLLHGANGNQLAETSSGTLPSKILRIVFDEDSPSEAAGPLGSVFVAFASVVDDQTVSTSQSKPSSLLHLLHCALLI